MFTHIMFYIFLVFSKSYKNIVSEFYLDFQSEWLFIEGWNYRLLALLMCLSDDILTEKVMIYHLSSFFFLFGMSSNLIASNSTVNKPKILTSSGSLQTSLCIHVVFNQVSVYIYVSSHHNISLYPLQLSRQTGSRCKPIQCFLCLAIRLGYLFVYNDIFKIQRPKDEIYKCIIYMQKGIENVLNRGKVFWES